MLTAIRQWVVRTMMKSKGETGIIKTLPSKDLIELNTQVTAQRLMQNGVDPTQLKNADQVENVINQIERSNTQVISQGDPRFQGIMDQLMGGKKSAKVFDMEGKRIDPKKGIMGGKQVDNDLPPPGSRGGPDDIAAPVQSADESLRNMTETEAEILARINKENKKGIESLKQKMKKEKARTKRISGNLRANNANRTEIGRPKLDEDEYDYYREILGEDPEVDYYPVKGDETKEFLEAMVKEQKDEMDYMKRLYDKGALDDPDKMATGGRAGFVAGGIANLAARLARGFMKVTGRKPNDEELMKIIREAAERDFAEVSDDVALKGVSETRAIARRMDSIDKDELKKIIDEYKMPVRTQEQFDFAQGGRAGYKFGLGPLLKFLNKKSPAKAYTDYLKSVKDRMKAGKEAEVAGEVIPIAAGGALITNQLKKKLKAMNEEQKKKIEKEAQEELRKDMKKADGGRAGFANGTGAPSIKYDFDKEQGPMEPEFETDDPKEAVKEILRRLIRIDTGQIPISKNVGLIIGTNPSIGIGGEVPLFGGGLKFGAGKNLPSGEEQFDFRFGKGLNNGSLEFGVGKGEEGLGGQLTFKKQFNQGGRVGLKVGSSLKFLQKVFGKEAFETMKTRDPEMYTGLLEVVDMYRKRDKEGLKMYLQKFLPHMDDAEIEDFIKGSDGSEGLIGELIRLGSGRDYAGKIEMIKKADEMRKLDNLEITEDMIRKPNADGGRIGFKDGMSRRTFLKIMGGLTALPILGKFFKGAKVASKAAPIIKTPNAPGKPEWFDALVTKVVNEGTDVTKGFATKERQLVHTKQINDFSEVTVYRDLDTNTTIVNYGSKLRRDPTKPYETGNIQRAVNDPDQIDLVVKGGEDVEPTIIENERGFVRRRGTKSSAEFEAYESEPRVVNYDGDMEFDGTNVVNNVDDLNEDVSVLKEYATGKKLTPKEAAKAKKKQEDYQKFLEDPVEQANYLENKYGPGPEPDDFASGGIARMLGE